VSAERQKHWRETESDSSACLSVHQHPAVFLQVRHDITVTPFAVPSLGRHSLMASATIHLSAVEDHGIPTLVGKFEVCINAWCRSWHDKQRTSHNSLRWVSDHGHTRACDSDDAGGRDLLRDNLGPAVRDEALEVRKLRDRKVGRPP
jgi:hypothetical protein